MVWGHYTAGGFAEARSTPRPRRIRSDSNSSAPSRSYNLCMVELPLSGRTALVTGGAVRLGRAIALGLTARGADIALHYRSSEPEAAKTAEEIRALGRKCAPIRADLEQPD